MSITARAEANSERLRAARARVESARENLERISIEWFATSLAVKGSDAPAKLERVALFRRSQLVMAAELFGKATANLVAEEANSA